MLKVAIYVPAVGKSGVPKLPGNPVTGRLT